MASRELSVIRARGTGASGLATPAARWAMVFVWSTGVVRGTLEGVFAPPAPLTVAAHIAVLAGVFLLTDRRDQPLGPGRGASLVAIALTATVAVVATTSAATDVWLLDFSTYLLALMLARGNVILAACAGAAQILIVVGWAVTTGQTFAGTLAMLTIPALSYVLGILWRVVLGWIVGAERAHRSERAGAERASAAADAARRRFRRELDRVRAEVEPTLRSIRDGEEIDPAMLTRVGVLEGAIRDRTFSPSLQHPRLDAAAADARARGVSVAMVADEIGPAATVTGEAAAGIARLIDEVPDGRVVISVDAADPTAVTVVTDGVVSGRTTLPEALRPS